MKDPYPTRRPTDASHLDGVNTAIPRELLNLPWIDPHNHAHTLSWEDRERFALNGCEAMVMVASGIHWTPYRPVRAEDVRYLWDGAIDRLPAIRRDHGFDARLAVGVQTGARVEDPHALLEAMESYLELETVVAVGETGVRPAQRGAPWPVDDQVDVLRSEFALADEHDLPVILHTPNPSGGAGSPYRSGVGTPGYEKLVGIESEPVLDGENPALEAVRLDVRAVGDAGLDEERVVASHADENNLAYLMEETDCRVSLTIGQPWMTGVSAATVAEAIDRYGPERVMVDTDAANVLRSDVSAIKRAILELYRRGIDVDDIRQVVYENPRDVFGIGG